jgi:hypothetical protein
LKVEPPVRSRIGCVAARASVTAFHLGQDGRGVAGATLEEGLVKITSSGAAQWR